MSESKHPPRRYCTQADYYRFNPQKWFVPNKATVNKLTPWAVDDLKRRYVLPPEDHYTRDEIREMLKKHPAKAQFLWVGLPKGLTVRDLPSVNSTVELKSGKWTVLDSSTALYPNSRGTGYVILNPEQTPPPKQEPTETKTKTKSKVQPEFIVIVK